MKHFNKQNEFNYQLRYDISLACNNRCGYCFQLERLDNSKLFDQTVFDKVVNAANVFLDEHPEYHLNMFLKGGEPMLLVDKIAEFYEKTFRPGKTKLNVLSNFNFKPNGTKIGKMIDLFSKSPTLELMCSVHDVSNIEWVKENVKIFKNIDPSRTHVYIIASDSSRQFAIEFAQWCVDNFGPKSYSISDIRLDGESKLDYDHPDIRPFIDAGDYTNHVSIDDKWYTEEEARILDFKNISKQYYTVCKLNSYVIQFDGTMTSPCGRPLVTHIDKGIDIPEIFCNNYCCSCELDSYKKLLRPKNNDTL